MRHQSISLAMDTYGHLFPGQEADAIGRLQVYLSPSGESNIQENYQSLQSGDATADTQRVAQQLGSGKGRVGAQHCDHGASLQED